mgnify:CR=1 FL=1
MQERMVVVAEITRLQSAPSPNLPIAPQDYSPQHYDILNNALRLYFNRLDQNLTALFGNTGSKYLNAPYVTTYSLADQYAGGNNIATLVAWDPTLGAINGFDLTTGHAVAQQSGTYRVEYNIQMANDDNAQHDAFFWFKVNGVTLADSTTKFTLQSRKSAGVPSYAVAASFIFADLQAGDYIELWWQTDKAATSGGTLGVWIEYQAAASNYPNIPSSLGSITFVSAPQA